jgi:hypothetical protein
MKKNDKIRVQGLQNVAIKSCATMVGKFGPSEVFTIVEEEGAENAYQSNATINSNNNGDEVEVAIDLLNIAGTFQAIFTPTPSTLVGPFELSPRFYVEMPPNPPTPTNNQQDDLAVNLEDSNLELDDIAIPSQTQGVIELGDLLSLPRLPTRRRHGKEPLVDYSSSHVVTLDQYLVVLKQKALEK